MQDNNMNLDQNVPSTNDAIDFPGLNPRTINIGGQVTEPNTVFPEEPVPDTAAVILDPVDNPDDFTIDGPIGKPEEPKVEIDIPGIDLDGSKKSTLGELENKVEKIYSELEDKNISEEVAQSIIEMTTQMYKKAICDITGCPEYMVTDEVVAYIRGGFVYEEYENGMLMMKRRSLNDAEVVEVMEMYAQSMTMVYSNEEVNSQSRRR